MSYRDGNAEIYVMDAVGANLLRLTDDPADDSYPAWSPARAGETGAVPAGRVALGGLPLVALSGLYAVVWRLTRRTRPA